MMYDSFPACLDDDDCETCAAVLAELENIDDEADKFGNSIHFNRLDPRLITVSTHKALTSLKLTTTKQPRNMASSTLRRWSTSANELLWSMTVNYNMVIMV